MNFMEIPMRNVQDTPNRQRYSTFPTVSRSRKLSTNLVDNSVRNYAYTGSNKASQKHIDLIAQNLTTAMLELHVHGITTLKAINADMNVKRYYTIRIDRNLFGETTISTSYGRIGSQGQLKNYYFETLTAGGKFIASTLRKRLNSKKRIGTEYKIANILNL